MPPALKNPALAVAKKLNHRQKAFVLEYLKDRNATEAAIRAGYSRKGANVTGSQLLAHPNIAAFVQQKTAKIARHAEVDAAFVIAELKRVAEQDDVSSAVKVRALELLGKHLGLLDERVRVSTDGLTAEQRAERVLVLLERARLRAAGAEPLTIPVSAGPVDPGSDTDPSGRGST